MSRIDSYSLSANALRMLVALLRKRGVVVDELLSRHNIDPALLDDVEARVPLRTACELWDDAARIVGDPNLGLTVGAGPPIGEGLIAYVAQASATMGDALRAVTRFHRLIADCIEPRLVEERDRARLTVYTPMVSPRLLRHVTEMYLAKLVYACRTFTHVEWNPLAVRFRHPAPKRLEAHHAFFRAPLAFDYGLDELEIDRALLRLPLHSAAPRLLDILDRYATEALSRLPPANDFITALRLVVATSLRHQEPALDRLAARFHTSPRTLQRRLAAAGLSLRDLVDDARHELALRYLERPDLSLAEIGFLLGFDAKQSFHRAFRRWTGVTPDEMRRRLRREADDARRR